MFLKGNAKKQAEVRARFSLAVVFLHFLTPPRLQKTARTTRSAPPRQIPKTRSPLQRRLAPTHLHLPRLRKPLPPRKAEVARRKQPPMPLPRLLLQILTLRRGVEAVRGSQSPLMVQQMSPRLRLRATPRRGAEAVRRSRAPPTRMATRLSRPLSQRAGGAGVVRRSQPKHKLLATTTKDFLAKGTGKPNTAPVEMEDERESYLSIPGKQSNQPPRRRAFLWLLYHQPHLLSAITVGFQPSAAITFPASQKVSYANPVSLLSSSSQRLCSSLNQCLSNSAS